MVIACDRCNTRFHVDDSRVPPKGVRVRCSRCKHAFFVVPPHSRTEDALHAAAAEAAVDPQPTGPGPSLDLDGPTAPGATTADVVHEEEEEDWQFAVEPPSAASARSEDPDDNPFDMAAVRGEFAVEDAPSGGDSLPDLSASRSVEKQEPSPPERGHAEPERSSLEDLDSPENWDFGAREPVAEVPTAPVVSEPPHARTPSPASESAAAADLGVAEDLSPATVRQQPTPSSAAEGTRFDTLARALGWCALVLLLGLGLHAAFRRPVAPPAAVRASVSLGPLLAGDISARRVENLQVGPLFVVRASLQTAEAEPAASGVVVRVVPTTSDGSPLPGAVLAGSELGARELRESPPEVLREALERSARALAWRTFEPGERARVNAVLAGLPREATHFRLETRPAPPPQPGSIPAEGEPADASPGETRGTPPAADPSTPGA